ncbi:MAG: MASE3 domain-containing protein, partial [Desulfovermiculus sp.]
MIWNRKELAVSLGVGGLGLAVLGLLSWYDFLLFHTVAELFSIVVAACVFIVTWNSRDNVDSTAYPLLGVAFLCIALLDGIHTLAYEGMPFFPAYDANLPTQLWIATRYLEALSLLGFVLLLGRRFPLGWPFAGYLLLTAGLVVLIFARLFPDCFVPGHGLTAFKIGSEYLICLLLITTLGLLRKQKEMFEPRLYALLQLSLTGTVLAELAFTFYVSTYGLSNLIGHYFKIISFYLIYKAVVATGLSQPQDLLFRKLRQSEERYDSLTRNLQGIAFRCRFDWTPVYIRGSVEAITGYYEQEFLDQNITWAGLVHDQDKEFFYDPELFAALQSEAGCSRKREYRIVRRDGHIRWLYESMHNVVGFGGIPTCIEGVRLDITEKKQNELELK